MQPSATVSATQCDCQCNPVRLSVQPSAAVTANNTAVRQSMQQCKSVSVQECVSATVCQCNSVSVQHCVSATVQQRSSQSNGKAHSGIVAATAVRNSLGPPAGLGSGDMISVGPTISPPGPLGIWVGRSTWTNAAAGACSATWPPGGTHVLCTCLYMCLHVCAHVCAHVYTHV